MLIHHKGHPRLVTALGKLYTTLMKREVDPMSEVSSKCFSAKYLLLDINHLITGFVVLRRGEGILHLQDEATLLNFMFPCMYILSRVNFPTQFYADLTPN